MKRTFFIIMVLFGICGVLQAKPLMKFQTQFVDEFLRPVNMGTSVSIYIYQAGTTTEISTYLDVSGGTAVTQPVTDDSTNTPLSYAQGFMQWYMAEETYKLYVTDGTSVRTFDNLTASNVSIMWPSFLTELSGYSLGQTDDLDFTYGAWVIDGDTAGRLDMIPDADGGVLGIGNGTYQADVYVYASSTDYMMFDEGNAQLDLIDIDLRIDDDAHVYIGTDKDVDIKFTNASDLLSILHTGGIIAFGSDGDAPDVTFYSETAGDYATFDEDNSRVNLVDYDLYLNDEADIIIGTTLDFVIDCDTAATLDITPLATDESPIINVGADTTGINLKVFGATTGEYFSWDASADSILANCGNSLFTQTDAEADQFKVDATGTVNGVAINFETTDGGILLNADGASYGDIELNAADNITLTAAGDLVLAVTGSFNMAGAMIVNDNITAEVVSGTTDVLTASQSGSTIIYTQTGGACTVTLPEATATEVGVYYILVDANPAAASDLAVDPEGAGTINGDTAGNYIKCEVDQDGQAVMIVCTAADTWYAIYLGGVAAWTEE